MELIEVKKLSKSIHGKEILKDISFEISQGDCVALIGPNGAGKTTLLRCLLGKEACDTGHIRFDGAATVGYAEQQARLGEGTLYEAFKGVFGDIHRLAEKKQALEKAMADSNTL